MRFSSLLSLLLASVAVAQNAAQSSLSKSVQPKPFPALEQRLGGTWLAQWRLATNTPHTIYGTGAKLQDWRGNSIEEARRHALMALGQHGDLLGLGASEFREIIGARMGRTWSFTFDQYFRGLPCIGGRADVRINMTGVLAMLGSSAWQIPANFDTTPKLGEGEAQARAWIALDQTPTGVSQPGKPRENRLVIWGNVHAESQSDFFLAWEVPVSNVDQNGQGPIGRYYIDAMTGAVLNFENDKHECGFANCGLSDTAKLAKEVKGTDNSAFVQTTVTVQRWTRTGNDAFVALSNAGVPGILLNVPGIGNVTTDSNGQFTVDIAAPVNVTIGALDGRHHSTIVGGTSPGGTFTITPGVPNTIQLGASTDTPEQASDVTTSYWIDRTNEFCRSILGNSTQLNTSDAIVPTVNIASTCNAYYTGNTINFYSAGGGCANTAFSTVIAHEWGHGLDERYGGISNTVAEGVSEAIGDFIGMYLVDSPLLGSGFQTAGVALRRGDNTNVYPYATTSPHGAGQVLMGFAWQMRQNLRTAFGTPTALQISNDVMIGAIVGNAPTRPEYVTQVFIADDDDGNLLNGVPHYTQLSAAAITKALPYPVKQTVSITHNTLQNTGDRYNSRVVLATASPTDAGTLTDLRLVYSAAGGASVSRAMVPSGGLNTFRAMLPGLASGQVSYHFEATSTTGPTRYPLTGELTYTVNAGIGGTYAAVVTEGFEAAGTPAGWTTGRLSATGTVDWQFGTPNGKSGTSTGVAWADPLGAPTGTRAVGTDLGAGTANGAYPNNIVEFVRSATFNMTGRSGVVLRFKRWLSVEEGIYDKAQIYCNGTLVWENDPNGNLVDTAWSQQEYALPMADNNPSVQVEFRLTTDTSLTLGGWNIDDFELGTRSVPALPAVMQMTPEQSSANQPVTLSVNTNGAPKLFVLVLGDTAGPTSAPGFPTAAVGGSLDFFVDFTNATGNYSLNYPSFPGMPAQGILVYSQVLVFEPDGSYSLSNQFKNLFIP